MKRFRRPLLSIIIVALSTFVSHNAPVLAQKAAKEIPYEALSEYVNDWDNRRDGERLVVTDVPVSGTITFERPYNMYLFRPDDSTDVGTAFYMSSNLAKALRPRLNADTGWLFIECTLIRFAGQFDVYRAAFATKIEGLNEDGKSFWTAVGPPPVKLKFRQ